MWYYSLQSQKHKEIQSFPSGSREVWNSDMSDTRLLPPGLLPPSSSSSSSSSSQALPQLQILQKLLHRDLIQEHEVRLPELQTLQLRHASSGTGSTQTHG